MLHIYYSPKDPIPSKACQITVSVLALLVYVESEQRSRSFSSISLSEIKGVSLWLAEVCAVVWDIWGERNDRVFWGMERYLHEIWSLIRFHVPLWASIEELL